jgi:hypothetical protein
LIENSSIYQGINRLLADVKVERARELSEILSEHLSVSRLNSSLRTIESFSRQLLAVNLDQVFVGIRAVVKDVNANARYHEAHSDKREYNGDEPLVAMDKLDHLFCLTKRSEEFLSTAPMTPVP